jgi:hypothetical protein
LSFLKLSDAALAAAECQAVGRLGQRGGSSLFWLYESISDVQARCARLVVPVPVVLAWFDRPWCGTPVVHRVIVCWAWFRSRLVLWA